MTNNDRSRLRRADGMLSTPDYSHLSKKDWIEIYEPAEDTFALLDALELDASRLRDTRPRICLEIGTGSGVVTAFLAALLGRDTAAFIGTDINLKAALATLKTAKQNSCSVDCVLTALCASLLPRLEHLVDVLTFNPPYVPTSEEEQLDAAAHASLSGAWAGGEDGMAVTNELLPLVPTLLSPRGSFYLVAVEQNKPEKIKATMLELGLQGETMLKRRAGGELLTILRFWKRT